MWRNLFRKPKLGGPKIIFFYEAVSQANHDLPMNGVIDKKSNFALLISAFKILLLRNQRSKFTFFFPESYSSRQIFFPCRRLTVDGESKATGGKAMGTMGEKRKRGKSRRNFRVAMGKKRKKSPEF